MAYTKSPLKGFVHPQPGSANVVHSDAIADIDILLGKCKRSKTHTGNVAFTAWIDTRVEAYMNAPTRGAKIHVIVCMTSSIYRCGGRFLLSQGPTPASPYWTAVNEDYAREKIGNSVRDAVKRLSKGTRRINSVAALFNEKAAFIDVVNYVLLRSQREEHRVDKETNPSLCLQKPYKKEQEALLQLKSDNFSELTSDKKLTTSSFISRSLSSNGSQKRAAHGRLSDNIENPRLAREEANKPNMTSNGIKQSSPPRQVGKPSSNCSIGNNNRATWRKEQTANTKNKAKKQHPCKIDLDNESIRASLTRMEDCIDLMADEDFGEDDVLLEWNEISASGRLEV